MKRRPHKIVSVVLLVVLIAGMGMACRMESLESRNKRWAENTETAGKILTESGKKGGYRSRRLMERRTMLLHGMRSGCSGMKPAELFMPDRRC